MYEADDKMISLIRDNYDLLQSTRLFRKLVKIIMWIPTPSWLW